MLNALSRNTLLEAVLLGKSLKVVSATCLQVCFVCLKKSTFETEKMFFISLQTLFSFSR